MTAGSQPKVFIAACSPRSGGNSDYAASMLQHFFSGASHVLRVADIPLHPCSSCGHCAVHPGICSSKGDGAPELFAHVARARLTIMVSPVYFYHLPAQAKAWVDRTQAFWNLPEADKPAAGNFFAAVLIGARPRGAKLFEGADLTLRYMAQALGMEWIQPLALYGLDGRDALKNNAQAQRQIREFAENAGRVSGALADACVP
ncbi:MAG: NAD(P)H-dependent oxidoreductase [Mailhella sp.]|nr:NAD(P)H-dependent oxidoreductase [Mailhella sp.]